MGLETKNIPVAKIRDNPFQPRRKYNPKDMEDLKVSIRETGLQQPLVVRQVGGDFELISGSRRLKVLRDLGEVEVPCVVRERDDADASLDALIENVQRKDLTAAEIAISVKTSADLFACRKTFGQQAINGLIASRTGLAKETIPKYLRAAELPENILQTAVEDGWPLSRLEKAVRETEDSSDTDRPDAGRTHEAKLPGESQPGGQGADIPTVAAPQAPETLETVENASVGSAEPVENTFLEAGAYFNDLVGALDRVDQKLVIHKQYTEPFRQMPSETQRRILESIESYHGSMRNLLPKLLNSLKSS